MKKLFILSLAVLALMTLQSCKSKGAADTCTGSSGCGGGGSGNAPTLRNLNLVFENSHYFDSNSINWREIQIARINAGDLGLLSLYSDTLAIPLNDALVSIKESETQVSNSDSPPELNNKIPYIRVKAQTGVKYFFEYKRIDSSNNIQALVKGEMDVIGQYAYLPLVNEKLENQLFATSIGSSSANSFTHFISVQSKATDANPSAVKTIKFKIDVKIPLKGIRVENSEGMNNFTLKNRWQTYFNGADYIARTDWDFASLVDNQANPDSIPYDIRFVFKTPPVLKLKQRLFVEETIDLLLYKTTGVKFPSRGQRFIVKTVELDSSNHFKSKFKINGTPVTLASGTSGEVRNIPSGERWKFTFAYDFSKNAAYSTAYDLLTPMRPECNIISNERIYPIQEISNRNASTVAGGFYSTCHPDTNGSISLASNQLATTIHSLNDIYYDYFQYRKSRSISDSPTYLFQDVGLFTGISDVEFSVEGCVKFFTREASGLTTNPYNWEPKNIPSEECGSGDFTAFSISAGDSIFNHVNEYAIQADLVQLINALGTVPTTERNDFIFNNSTNLDVIY